MSGATILLRLSRDEADLICVLLSIGIKAERSRDPKTDARARLKAAIPGLVIPGPEMITAILNAISPAEFRLLRNYPVTVWESLVNKIGAMGLSLDAETPESRA